MDSTEVMSEVPVDAFKDPVKIKDEDAASLGEVQVLVGRLAKYRQEMGRLVQLLGNMREDANRIEVDLATKRRALAAKYNLEQAGPGQWALDFENKEFVKAAPGAPTIP